MSGRRPPSQALTGISHVGPLIAPEVSTDKSNESGTSLDCCPLLSSLVMHLILLSNCGRVVNHPEPCPPPDHGCLRSRPRRVSPCRFIIASRGLGIPMCEAASPARPAGGQDRGKPREAWENGDAQGRGRLSRAGARRRPRRGRPSSGGTPRRRRGRPSRDSRGRTRRRRS